MPGGGRVAPFPEDPDCQARFHPNFPARPEFEGNSCVTAARRWFLQLLHYKLLVTAVDPVLRLVRILGPKYDIAANHLHGVAALLRAQANLPYSDRNHLFWGDRGFD